MLRRETVEAWALTEPGAGSDLGAIATTAERDGDDWVLNGEKWFVTGGDKAGVFAVLARAGDAQELFLVARDHPGLEIVRAPRFMHDPYVDSHVELRLAGCRVPDRDRLPSGDDGARRWITIERLMIAARCCGAAARVLELASEWASERVAFGRPIAEYQGVSFPLADSLAELLAARLLTYHAAHELDANPSPSVAHGKVAIAKLIASETANRIADRAVQIFGGRGYMTENPVERHFRELRVDRIWEGTSEIQRLIVARGLLKRGIDVHISTSTGETTVSPWAPSLRGWWSVLGAPGRARSHLRAPWASPRETWGRAGHCVGGGACGVRRGNVVAHLVAPATRMVVGAIDRWGAPPAPTALLLGRGTVTAW